MIRRYIKHLFQTRDVIFAKLELMLRSASCCHVLFSPLKPLRPCISQLGWLRTGFGPWPCLQLSTGQFLSFVSHLPPLEKSTLFSISPSFRDSIPDPEYISRPFYTLCAPSGFYFRDMIHVQTPHRVCNSLRYCVKTHSQWRGYEYTV